MVNWWERRSPTRVEVDERRRRLRLRAGPNVEWIEVPLFRDIRSHLDTPDVAFVAWYGDMDDNGDDLPLEPDEPTVSAYAYDGTCLWTLHGRDLPYYDRQGTRKRGISYVSQEIGPEGSRLLLRCGPWYCEILDVHGPKLGPVEHTQPPKR